MKDPLIAYSFVNMYISGIHAGIQTAHALVELGLSFGSTSRVYKQWASTDKTLIIKNGRGSNEMTQMKRDIAGACYTLDIPCATFVEPDADNLLTAIVFIVPQSFAEWQDPRSTVMLPTYPAQYKKEGTLRPDEIAISVLANYINTSHLAR